MPLRTLARPSPARSLIALPFVALVAAYMILDGIVGPLVRPLAAALARMRLLARLRAWLERLGPYQALVALAVPLAVLEPLKLLALAWIALGHIAVGTAGLLALHGISFLSTERLFSVLLPKLLTIGWFSAIWSRIVAIRDRLMTLVRSSPLWPVVVAARRAARRTRARLVVCWRRARAA